MGDRIRRLMGTGGRGRAASDGQRRDGLTFQVRDEGVAAAITLRGHLDERTAGEFERGVASLRSAGASFLLVDLHEIEGIDSAGMLAVLGAEADSRERRLDFVVVPPPARVHREFWSDELKKLLCMVHYRDADWLLDFYGASRLTHT